jgi:hypothetical protein
MPALCECIRKAAYDPRVRGLYLHVEPLAIGYARLQVRTHTPFETLPAPPHVTVAVVVQTETVSNSNSNANSNSMTTSSGYSTCVVTAGCCAGDHRAHRVLPEERQADRRIRGEGIRE